MTTTQTPLPLTDRTRTTRHRERQQRDRDVLRALLDDALVAHVAACVDGEPVVLPMACGRHGEELVLHGSTGAGLLRAVAAGARVAVGVTHVDGLVFARSAFDSSMNYRSAVVFGVPRRLEGDAAVQALAALTEHLMPGRWDEVRPTTGRELAATVVLALSLEEASVKVRTGGPSDDGDVDPSVWAGVLPLAVRAGAPLAADDVPAGVPTPPSVREAARRRGAAVSA